MSTPRSHRIVLLFALLLLAGVSVPAVAYAQNPPAGGAAAQGAAGGAATGAPAGGSVEFPLKIKDNTNLILLQPLDDSTTSLEAAPGIQIFFDYFNLSWPWILGVAAGLAVLQAMVGGMEMMLVSRKDDGKNRMMWATAGLLIIALAGMILSTINPLFFT